MGRATRRRPVRLAEKLLEVRMNLGLSQNGIIRRLGLTEELTQDYVSGYERGMREPDLLVLLRYAHLAGVCLDVLVNDELDLPRNLPSRPKHRAGAT